MVVITLSLTRLGVAFSLVSIEILPTFRHLRCFRHLCFCASTSPAKAGVQVGSGGNDGQSLVISAFPPGPRPPPGRRNCWRESASTHSGVTTIANVEPP